MDAPIDMSLRDQLEATFQKQQAEPAPEVVQTPTSAPQSDDLEKRFAKLNSASAKIQQERKELAAEREQRKAEWEEYKMMKEARERAQEDPAGWAALGGYKDADVYATSLIEKGALTPERRRLLEQDKEIRGLKSWKEQQEQERIQNQRRSEESAMLNQIRQFGESDENSEAFDLVNRFKAHHLVLNEITQHYNSTREIDGEGEVLDLQEAYKRVEDRLDKEISPALESPKYRSRFSSVQPAQTTGTPASIPAPRNPQGTTITGRMRASSAPPREMTHEERMEAAGRLLLGIK